MSELVDFMNDRWTFVKFAPQKKDFLTPDDDQTRDILMTGEFLEPLSYGDPGGGLRDKFDVSTAFV